MPSQAQATGFGILNDDLKSDLKAGEGASGQHGGHAFQPSFGLVPRWKRAGMLRWGCVASSVLGGRVVRSSEVQAWTSASFARVQRK